MLTFLQKCFETLFTIICEEEGAIGGQGGAIGGQGGAIGGQGGAIGGQGSY